MLLNKHRLFLAHANQFNGITEACLRGRGNSSRVEKDHHRWAPLMGCQRENSNWEKSDEKKGSKSRAVDFSIRLNKKPRDKQTRWKLAAFFSAYARIVFRFSREEGTVGKSCCAYLSIKHPPDFLLDARILYVTSRILTR